MASAHFKPEKYNDLVSEIRNFLPGDDNFKDRINIQINREEGGDIVEITYFKQANDGLNIAVEEGEALISLYFEITKNDNGAIQVNEFDGAFWNGELPGIEPNLIGLEEIIKKPEYIEDNNQGGGKRRRKTRGKKSKSRKGSRKSRKSRVNRR